MSVDGYPPVKTLNQSLRNPKHRWYQRFVALRRAAQEAMAGRAWYFGAVRLDLDLFAPALERNLTVLDYVAGVEDTLDGSQGRHFTYLPIVYSDDCQIVKIGARVRAAEMTRYEVLVSFM